jgi:uncharacterized protein (DUF2164 family)
MFTIRFDPATAALIKRLLDYLEGAQQKEIDGLAARMKATRERLAGAVSSSKQ